MVNKKTKLLGLGVAAGSLSLAFLGSATPAQAYTFGGVDFGNTLDYLFIFTDGSQDANWQSASKGFVGDVAVNGVVASERTSGTFGYKGTISTNDTTLGAWQGIVDDNNGSPNNNGAVASLNQVALINNLKNSVNSVFTQINTLPATNNAFGNFTSRSSTSLNGLNTQNGVSDTIVINVTSGLNFSSQINVTGDESDIYILRWDTDANFANGYDGQVKPQSGGAIVPLGGLSAANFFHVAGDINSSGGGSTPTANNFPQGPRDNNGQGALCNGCDDFSGGGYFTGYWFTTGSPDNPADMMHSVPYGNSSSLSNGIFVGGWYSINNKFSMTSGTSGVYVEPIPEPLTILGAGTAAGFGAFFKRQVAKKKKDEKEPTQV